MDLEIRIGAPRYPVLNAFMSPISRASVAVAGSQSGIPTRTSWARRSRTSGLCSRIWERSRVEGWSLPRSMTNITFVVPEPAPALGRVGLVLLGLALLAATGGVTLRHSYRGRPSR